MKTKKTIVTAMLVALATVLSFIKPFALPFGGGITLASMMPIVLIGFIYGTKTGLIAGLIYSLIQMMTDPGTISAAFLPGENQMVLYKAILMCLIDYVLAFTCLGLGGIFKDKVKNEALALSLGAAVATFLRYVCHIISGVILWGSWAEWFFSQEGFYKIGSLILDKFTGNALAFIYSVFYNGLYMVPEIIITAIACPLIYKAVKRSKLI